MSSHLGHLYVPEFFSPDVADDQFLTGIKQKHQISCLSCSGRDRGHLSIIHPLGDAHIRDF